MVKAIEKIPERALTPFAFDDAWEENRKVMRVDQFLGFRNSRALKEFAQTLRPAS
jgi:hypothetical protein